MPGSSYLVDTNILLRLVQPDSPEYGKIRRCTDRLWARGAELFYTSQNLAEFWNFCTRPADRNAFGFSVAETDERVAKTYQIHWHLGSLTRRPSALADGLRALCQIIRLSMAA